MTYKEANNISIKDYLNSLGIQPVTEKGSYGMYRSPLREDNTPSFKVDYNANLWCDYGTGEGGTLIDLVMKQNGCNAYGAICRLEQGDTAFANADGGYLLIGVDDNGQIIGTGLENDKRSAIQGSISEISPALHCDMYAVNIEDKTVWVIDVPSGKDKPYIFSGSIFVREGATSQKLRTVEEMRSFFQECNKIFFDAIPCSWFNIYTDADEQAIKDFRTEAKLSPSTANNRYLRIWNCLRIKE